MDIAVLAMCINTVMRLAASERSYVVDKILLSMAMRIRITLMEMDIYDLMDGVH